MPELDFIENLAIWTFTGLLAISGTPGAAIAFVTIAPKFVLAMRTGDLGAIVHIFVDGQEAYTGSTYSASPGVLNVPIIADPTIDTHQIYVQKDDDPDTTIQVIRKELSANEITPPGTRYNVDCDCVQVTSDGGSTWTDAPGLDPRHADSFRVPALTTADPKCDAAANMVAFLHSLINADIAAANTVAMATAFIGLVTLFFPVLLVADLVLAVAGIVAGIGVLALEAAFTDAVYAALLCTFLAHLEADGSMTAGDLSDLMTDIGANYDATVFDVISAHSSALGEVGWSNAGASGSETGDCSACASGTCYGVDWTVDADDVSTHVYAATWISGRGYAWVVVDGSGTANISTLWNDATPCLYTRCEVDVFTYIGGVEYAIYGRTNNDIPDHDQTLFGSGVCDTGLSTIGIDLPGTDSYYGLQIVLTMPGSDVGGMDIHGARIFSPNLSAAGLVSNC